MLLKEFLYFNDDTNDFAVDRRYDNSKDSSVVELDDTRKIKLTLNPSPPKILIGENFHIVPPLYILRMQKNLRQK